MIDTKPKRGKDTTRTPRQKDYLERLESSQGSRLVADLEDVMTKRFSSVTEEQAEAIIANVNPCTFLKKPARLEQDDGYHLDD